MIFSHDRLYSFSNNREPLSQSQHNPQERRPIRARVHEDPTYSRIVPHNEAVKGPTDWSDQRTEDSSDVRDTLACHKSSHIFEIQ